MRRRRRSAARALRRGKRWGGRYLARYRRNPVGGLVGSVITAAKVAVPVAASLYLTRFASSKAGMIPVIGPQLERLGRARRPIVAALMVLAGNVLTGPGRFGFLRKFRTGVMLGTGINLVDAIVSAIAPDTVKGMFGLSDADGIYDEALSEYTQVGDYVEVGDYEEEMGDYIAVGAEEDLGMEQEMGFEQEMGDPLDRDYLGGTGRGDMVAPVGHSRMLAAVPRRSFTKEVPGLTDRYDAGKKVYTGIFAGGF